MMSLFMVGFAVAPLFYVARVRSIWPKTYRRVCVHALRQPNPYFATILGVGRPHNKTICLLFAERRRQIRRSHTLRFAKHGWRGLIAGAFDRAEKLQPAPGTLIGSRFSAQPTR